MSFYHLKDLANEMGLHPRQVKRWTKKLKVPPTVPSQPAHKWSRADKDRLIRLWRQYWLDRQANVKRLVARKLKGESLSKKELSQIGTFYCSNHRG